MRSLKTYDSAFRWEVHRVKLYTALPASKVVIQVKQVVSGETQAKTVNLLSETVAVGQTDTLKCSWSLCKTRQARAAGVEVRIPRIHPWGVSTASQLRVLLAIPCRVCGAAFVAVVVDEWDGREIPREMATCKTCKGHFDTDSGEMRIKFDRPFDTVLNDTVLKCG